MKIEQLELVWFDSINAGEVFMFEENYFIRFEGSMLDGFNAVKLENGRLFCFNPGDMVLPKPNAKLISG